MVIQSDRTDVPFLAAASILPPSPHPVLLNKHNLAVADFASTSQESSLSLRSVHVTQTHTVATDAYHLVEVENVKPSPGGLPVGLVSDDKPVLIPVSSIKKIEKLVPRSEALPI